NNGVGNGFDGCVGSNAAYMYMSLPTQPGYKLIAHCVPTSGLNQAEAKPPSAYCTINVGSWEDGRYGLDGFILTPGGNPAHSLKSMVDPVRFEHSFAIYTENYTCV